MSLWGSFDDAGSAPKNIAEMLQVGSGSTNKQANNQALFNNTTANTVHNGQTVAIVNLSSSQIGSGQYPGAVSGWNIKRTGSGGRAGRTWYEPITTLGLSQLFSLNSRLVFLGDSITAGSVGPSFANYSLIASGGQYYVPPNGNQGVGGNTTDQMLARSATWTALGARVIVVMGGTNDVTNSESSSTTTLNLRAIYNSAKASGALVVACTILPRNDSTWTGNSGYEPVRQAINSWIRSQTDVLVVDLESSFNPSTMTVEGLHPNNTGAAVVGSVVGQALSTLVPPSILFTNPTDFGSILANGGMTGSQSADAPCTGLVPSGWHAETNVTGATVACSLTTVNGYNGVTFTWSGTATAAGVIGLYTDTTFTGNTGDVYDAWCGFSANVGANCYGVWMGAAGAQTWLPSAPASALTQNVSGVFRCFGQAMSSPATDNRIQVGVYLGTGAVSGSFTAWAPTLRKVPASQ